MNKFLNFFQALPIPMRLRSMMLRPSGLKISRNSGIYSNVFFGSDKCVIGEGCFVNTQCYFDGSDLVMLGKNVYLAMGVRLITSSHEIGPPEKRAGRLTSAKVKIGDGCWLGAGCQILPGVSIADGCLIAAGAVVVNDTEQNGLYAGVPARRIRTLFVDSK